MGEEAGQTPGLSAVLVQCFMHRRQASVAAAASECSLAAGKGRGWRKGIACRKHSGSAKGEKGAGGKMPGRWRNAGGGGGAVLRILGVFIVQIC